VLRKSRYARAPPGRGSPRAASPPSRKERNLQQQSVELVRDGQRQVSPAPEVLAGFQAPEDRFEPPSEPERSAQDHGRRRLSTAAPVRDLSRHRAGAFHVLCHQGVDLLAVLGSVPGLRLPGRSRPPASPDAPLKTHFGASERSRRMPFTPGGTNRRTRRRRRKDWTTGASRRLRRVRRLERSERPRRVLRGASRVTCDVETGCVALGRDRSAWRPGSPRASSRRFWLRSRFLNRLFARMHYALDAGSVPAAGSGSANRSTRSRSSSCRRSCSGRIEARVAAR